VNWRKDGERLFAIKRIMRQIAEW